jgi:uncharacterized protein (DUF302 family)
MSVHVDLARMTAKAGLCLLFLANVGARTAHAEPVLTSHTIQVEHIVMVSQKSFEAVRAALGKAIPQLDTSYVGFLVKGDGAGAKEKLENGPPLSFFSTRNPGRLLQIAGQAHKAIQYEIGNPFTASKMTRHQLSAALYAPLRVLLYENADGHAVFEYDLPSSLFGQFGDEEVTAVARDLDKTLENALRQAAE